jgi:hypothetical protein
MDDAAIRTAFEAPKKRRSAPVRFDAIDCVLTEAARLAMLALETLKQARLLPNKMPQHPLPRVRAATLLRCAATILDDLG